MQQTGESWPSVRVTLSTARPSLDAVPPELLPLKMAVAGVVDSGPIDAQDDKSQKIREKLNEPVSMSFSEETPLEDVLKYIKKATTSSNYSGIPIYVDPIGLQEVEKSMTSTVRNINLDGVALKVTLKLLLNQLGLTYTVKNGLLTITSSESAESEAVDDERAGGALTGGMGGGMGGGSGLAMEQFQASGGARLNREAATDQAEELRVADRQDAAIVLGRERQPKRDVSHHGPPRYPLAARSAVARSRAGGAASRLLRQGCARLDTAGISPGQAHEQKRCRALAG